MGAAGKVAVRREDQPVDGQGAAGQGQGPENLGLQKPLGGIDRKRGIPSAVEGDEGAGTVEGDIFNVGAGSRPYGRTIACGCQGVVERIAAG